MPGVSNLAAFQPAGDSVVCTSFEIIDDLLALEEDEKFVVDVGPEEGDVEFGDNNRTTVTILDDDGTYIFAATYTIINYRPYWNLLCMAYRKLCSQVEVASWSSIIP